MPARAPRPVRTPPLGAFVVAYLVLAAAVVAAVTVLRPSAGWSAGRTLLTTQGSPGRITILFTTRTGEGPVEAARSCVAAHPKAEYPRGAHCYAYPSAANLDADRDRPGSRACWSALLARGAYGVVKAENSRDARRAKGCAD